MDIFLTNLWLFGVFFVVLFMKLCISKILDILTAQNCRLSKRAKERNRNRDRTVLASTKIVCERLIFHLKEFLCALFQLSQVVCDVR